MKPQMFLVLILLAGAPGCRESQSALAGFGTRPVNSASGVNAMKLSSPDFNSGDFLPPRFTCDGQNISPGLLWSGVPSQAQSLALVCEDPDAPSGNFVHWIVVNLPVTATGIPQAGPLPAGAVGVANDFGTTAYGGPCPPSGVHRYFFRVYALDVDDLPTVSRHTLAAALKKHTVALAEIMGRYARR
jgi:Raf kinase inhibitor-like YbhB/YbcL family protein